MVRSKKLIQTACTSDPGNHKGPTSGANVCELTLGFGSFGFRVEGSGLVLNPKHWWFKATVVVGSRAQGLWIQLANKFKARSQEVTS